MSGIIFQVVVILGLVALLAFVAYDDKKTTLLRQQEEDSEKSGSGQGG